VQIKTDNKETYAVTVLREHCSRGIETDYLGL